MKSLKQLLEAKSWIVATCHWYDMYAQRRKDLYGIIDWECLDEKGNLIYIQETKGKNASARRQKILDKKEVVRRLMLKPYREIQVYDYVGKQKKYKRGIWNIYKYNKKKKDIEMCEKMDSSGEIVWKK